MLWICSKELIDFAAAFEYGNCGRIVDATGRLFHVIYLGDGILELGEDMCQADKMRENLVAMGAPRGPEIDHNLKEEEKVGKRLDVEF